MSEHREISVAEFFEKNRHLLGFSSLQKAVVTCVKEAVDNSLDSAEDARILPEIHVEIEELQGDRIRITIRDNAEGIAKEHIPKVFGKLLYGSKFHSLVQSRGQQGIGISASALYSQLTTGNPVRIRSKQQDSSVHYFELVINTERNEPEIITDRIIEDYPFSSGTEISLDIEGKYMRGQRSVLSYLKYTAITNPHATIVLQEPDGTKTEFPRVTEQMPTLPQEIKPHPHGVELGILMRMMQNASSRTVQSFLMNAFTRVGKTAAQDMCSQANVESNVRPKALSKEQIESLLHSMQKAKLQNPPTDCLSPIGESLLEEGLKKELDPEFISVVTRKPAVYRGMPFQIEAAIAYGGNITEDQHKLLRFANKVPLLYNQGACASTQAIKDIDWGRYGLKDSGGVPEGPVTVLVHVASVWVPFTSEGKEAIADYPEIMREMTLALQEVGRKIKLYVGKKRKAEMQQKKLKLLNAYSKEIAEPLAQLADIENTESLQKQLVSLVENKYTEAALVENTDESEESEGEEEETAPAQ